MEHFDRLTYASCACTLLVAGGCFLGACGGSAAATDTTLPVSTEPVPVAEAARPSTVAHAHGDHQATARIGRAGGDLTLGNGARLEIPPGAITEETEVVFSLGEAVNAFRNREDEKMLRSESGQQKYADAILSAIKRYKREHEKLLLEGKELGATKREE